MMQRTGGPEEVPRAPQVLVNLSQRGTCIGGEFPEHEDLSVKTMLRWSSSRDIPGCQESLGGLHPKLTTQRSPNPIWRGATWLSLGISPMDTEKSSELD